MGVCDIQLGGGGEGSEKEKASKKVGTKKHHLYNRLLIITNYNMEGASV